MIKIRSFDLNSDCVFSVMTVFTITQHTRGKCSAFYAAITLFILISQAIEKWLARWGIDVSCVTVCSSS